MGSSAAGRYHAGRDKVAYIGIGSCGSVPLQIVRVLRDATVLLIAFCRFYQYNVNKTTNDALDLDIEAHSATTDKRGNSNGRENCN